jgi:hypothetical protein
MLTISDAVFSRKQNIDVQGLFEKIVASPYCSESELWQVMYFLQCSTPFSKPWCRPLITSKFLASELPFHG